MVQAAFDVDVREAVGHPFGATGGRIIAGLAKLLAQKGRGRGLISICTGGGMGVTAILER